MKEILLLSIFLSVLVQTSLSFSQDSVSDTLLVLDKQKLQNNENIDKAIRNIQNRLFQLNKSDNDFESLPDKRKVLDKIKKDLNTTHGAVSLAYSYGLNTVFIDTSRAVGSIFNTRGDFSTGIAGMPVSISFNYSTLRVPLGANNYFRVSLDKERLIKQQKEKLSQSLFNVDNQLEKLGNKQALLSGLMGYVEIYMDALKRKAEREASNRKNKLIENARDSLSKRSAYEDSIDYSVPSYSDTMLNLEANQRMADQLDEYDEYYDSLQRIYKRIQNLKITYDSLTNTLESSKQLLNTSITQLNTQNALEQGGGKINFLQSLRTLDIGLTYPQTTSLSDQNVPIKGVHAVFQFGKYYVSVASGLTLNNLMLSTDELQNKLNYSQNVFNNFDFQHVLDNGWLTAIRTGYGTPEGTHAFIGFNYLTNTRFLNNTSTNQASYDPSASIELDFRYVPTFYSGGAIDLVYGKTSRNILLDSVSSTRMFESVFSAYPSHFLLGKYTQSVSKIHSDFSLSYRRIDAYANTTQFGMLQPNNQRIEVRSKHKIKSYLKLGLRYQLDETIEPNIGMEDIRLMLSGVDASGHISSHFNYSVMFNHVHHQIDNVDSQTRISGNDYLFGVILSSNYTVEEKTKTTTTTSYNEYLFRDEFGINKYGQFGIQQIFMERKYMIGIIYDYFFKRNYDVRDGVSVFGVRGSYLFKRAKIDLGIKLSNTDDGIPSLGGHIETMIQVYKFLDLGFRAERFVNGDFHRNYYRKQYEQFPYLMTFQTIFKL